MNQQEILKKIGGIIAELKDQHTYLEASGNSFNELELELFMANANFLTDHIEILKKIHHQVKPIALPNAEPIFSAENVSGRKLEIPDYFTEEEIYAEEDNQPETISVPPIESFILKEQEIVPTEITQSETILLPESFSGEAVKDQSDNENASFTKQKVAEPEITDLPEPENVFFEPEVTPIENVSVKPEVNIEPEREAESVSFVTENIRPEPAKPSIIKQEEPLLTLNQRIAAQRASDQQKAEVKTTSQEKVQDLQSLISLNDKLLFVKELFNGYNLAYSEAINILNRYTNFAQAEQFLNLNYAVKNNWKEKPVTSERFFELLRKKFS